MIITLPEVLKKYFAILKAKYPSFSWLIDYASSWILSKAEAYDGRNAKVLSDLIGEAPEQLKSVLTDFLTHALNTADKFWAKALLRMAIAALPGTLDHLWDSLFNSGSLVIRGYDGIANDPSFFSIVAVMDATDSPADDRSRAVMMGITAPGGSAGVASFSPFARDVGPMRRLAMQTLERFIRNKACAQAAAIAGVGFWQADNIFERLSSEEVQAIMNYHDREGVLVNQFGDGTFLKGVIENVKEFYEANKDWIDPIIKAIVQALLAALIG